MALSGSGAAARRSPRLRILFVSHRFVEDSVGGTEVLCGDLASAMAARGHRVHWLAALPAGGAAAQPAPPGGVARLGVEPAFAPGYPVGWREQEAVVAARIDGLLGRAHLRFDVVHLLHFARVGLAFLDLPRLAGARLFFTLTDYTAVCPDFQLFRRATRRICPGPDDRACAACVGVPDGGGEIPRWRARNLEVLRSRAAGIFVQTPHQRRLLAAAGVPDAAFVYDRGCYALPADPPRRPPRGTRPYRFAYFGRLSVEKGVDVLSDAASLLGAATCEYHVFGLPDEGHEALRGRLAAIPGCVVHPPVPRERLFTALEEVDCVLVPSLWLENHATIITCALDRGADVICSDVASLTHLAGTPRLFFAEPGNPRAWRDRMEARLAEATRFPGHRRIGRRGPGPRYGFDRLVRLTARAYATGRPGAARREGVR